jgi:Type III restriction enzyme, res subunit
MVSIDVILTKTDNGTTVKTIVNMKQIAQFINGDALVAFIKFITEQQTSVLNLFNGGKEEYKPYSRIGDNLILPRFMYQYIEDYFRHNKISYTINHKSHRPIDEYRKRLKSGFGKLKIEIFPDKLAVIDMIIANLEANKGLIVKLDTGKGKSVIISEITRRLGIMTHIVTKDKTLQQQMFDEIHTNMHLDCAEDCANCLSKSGASNCKYIALLGGVASNSNTNLLDRGNYKILISIINSAAKKPSDFWKSFGMTVFDECHNYTSFERSKIFENCQSPYMLGTSATPDRKWNCKLIEHNIGRIVDYDRYIDTKGMIKATVYKILYRGPPEHTMKICNKKGIVSVAKMVEQFMNDPNRNEILIELIIYAVRNHKHGFVFAMRNDFLFMLKDMLDNRCAKEGIPMISVVLCSGISSEEKQIAMKSANVIFTNYAFSEGLNIVHTRFEILASPYKENGKQITGRIMRKNLDDERFFYDLIDTNTSLKSQYRERKDNYYKRGFTIRKLTTEEVFQLND